MEVARNRIVMLVIRDGGLIVGSGDSKNRGLPGEWWRRAPYLEGGSGGGLRFESSSAVSNSSSKKITSRAGRRTASVPARQLQAMGVLSCGESALGTRVGSSLRTSNSRAISSVSRLQLQPFQQGPWFTGRATVEFPFSDDSGQWSRRPHSCCS